MALFKQDVGVQVEEFASQLERKASSPPQLLWRVEASSRLDRLDARSSVLGSATSAQHDRGPLDIAIDSVSESQASSHGETMLFDFQESSHVGGHA